MESQDVVVTFLLISVYTELKQLPLEEDFGAEARMHHLT